MNRTSIVLSVLLICALITGGMFFNKNRLLHKEIVHLENNIDDLKGQVEELESKLSSLEDEKEELQDKLSEVKHFDEDGFSTSSSGVSYTGDALKTNIDGAFNGWEGDTIFQMMDGSIWKQSSYDYTYHYAYNPEVLIYRKNGGYHMRVKGVDDEIMVTRLK
jgi:hypothetical protein